MLPARVHRAIGNRRIGLVGAIGEQDEDEEAGEEDEAGHLEPGAGNEQLTLPIRLLGGRHADGLLSFTPSHANPTDRRLPPPILCLDSVGFKDAGKIHAMGVPSVVLIVS